MTYLLERKDEINTISFLNIAPSQNTWGGFRKVKKPLKRTEKFLLDVEARFKEVADLNCNLQNFPSKCDDTQVKTRKDKSKAHGEVFTPLHLVDKMVSKKDDAYWLDESKVNCDLCSGYGQFTIRILRKKLNLNKNYPLEDYLLNNHVMVELQESSVLKLMYVFGVENITLCVGDARKLTELKETDRGIMLHNGNKWLDISKMAKQFYYKHELDDKMPCEKVFSLWGNKLKGIS